jgi:hypothetical protein
MVGSGHEASHRRGGGDELELSLGSSYDIRLTNASIATTKETRDVQDHDNSQETEGRSVESGENNPAGYGQGDTAKDRRVVGDQRDDQLRRLGYVRRTSV